MANKILSSLVNAVGLYGVLKVTAAAIDRFADAPGLELAFDSAAPLVSGAYLISKTKISEKNNAINSFAVGGISLLMGCDIANTFVNSDCYIGAVNFLRNGFNRLGEATGLSSGLATGLTAGCAGFAVNGYFGDKDVKENTTSK